MGPQPEGDRALPPGAGGAGLARSTPRKGAGGGLPAKIWEADLAEAEIAQAETDRSRQAEIDTHDTLAHVYALPLIPAAQGEEFEEFEEFEEAIVTWLHRRSA